MNRAISKSEISPTRVSRSETHRDIPVIVGIRVVGPIATSGLSSIDPPIYGHNLGDHIVATVEVVPQVLGQMVIAPDNSLTQHDGVGCAVCNRGREPKSGAQAIKQPANVARCKCIAMVRTPAIAPSRLIAITLV